MSYIGNTSTQQAFTPAIDYFSGDGSTVAFTLSRPVASSAQVQVVVNNVPQNPSIAFTVLNSTITFTGAPSSGTNNIYVEYVSPITQVMQPGQGTVGATQIADNAITTSKIAAGAVVPADLSTGGPYWDTSGNVGIGTSSPVYRLHSKATDSSSISGIFETSVSAGAFISFKDTVTAQPYNVRVGSIGENLVFQTSSAERARIDSSGNLLVGKTSTSGDVTTAGAFIAPTGKCVFTTTGASQPLVLARNNNTGAMIEFYYGGSVRGSVTTNGTTIAYNTSSDYRLKENIAPMSGALATVSQLKPVTYTWKFNGESTQGFIAHELQAVVPECVTGEKDAVDADGNPVYQGIDTSFLVATLTAAIQELKAINDTQAQVITTLTERITALEAK